MTDIVNSGILKQVCLLNSTTVVQSSPAVVTTEILYYSIQQQRYSYERYCKLWDTKTGMYTQFNNSGTEFPSCGYNRDIGLLNSTTVVQLRKIL